MAGLHGRPVWYELNCASGMRAQAGEFYAALLGWTITDAGMEGFDYRLAAAEGDMVAGLMDLPAGCGSLPPFWLIHFGVDDADAAVARAVAMGATLHRPPADIPGTGRFAILSDPQGAGFGILQADPMATGTGGNAFDQGRAGHGNWTELMTSDPAAALAFYGTLLGWQPSTVVEMGALGRYRLFAHDGADIGGMQGLGHAPRPHWLPYFGFNGICEAIARIPELGGEVLHGPQEVPGGAFIVIARDPQGAQFAMVGPEHHSD